METLVEEVLANNLRIKITDHSRVIAADRWYVKIVCAIILPLADEHFAGCHEDEQELLVLIRHRLGDEIMMELVQERNFVDAAVKDEVVRELLARISENMTGYLSAASFPGRFFAVRYAEERNACLAAMARAGDIPAEEVDEPADFSACFRD
jgi:hypothetical protein